MDDNQRYRTALLDWLACAVGGNVQPAARAARAAGEGLLGRIAAAGTAGHILDYDDTYSPGVIHATACAGPAALLLGAELGKTVGDVVEGYAAGFEAASALARGSHPQLYERGWHPTAVCGTVGAATAAARLLGLDQAGIEAAVALAVLRAGGLRAAFGSDGKSLQVGMAAAAGTHAAQLVANGVQVPLTPVAKGFEQAFGGRWATRDPGAPAIRENWIKPWPCCLFTHSTIEAVSELGEPHRLDVLVHPRALEAAAFENARNGLEAKFSIPYLAAYTSLHGPPTLASFAALDDAAYARARDHVSLRPDPHLGEWEAVVGDVRVEYALGSPQRPLDPATLQDKISDLAGDRLDGILEDPSRPAADVLAAAEI